MRGGGPVGVACRLGTGREEVSHAARGMTEAELSADLRDGGTEEATARGPAGQDHRHVSQPPDPGP